MYASLVGGDGLAQLLLLREGEAEVVVGYGVFGIDVDGLVVGGDGLGQLLLLIEGEAEVVVGRGVFRIVVDGVVVRDDGLGQLLCTSSRGRTLGGVVHTG